MLFIVAALLPTIGSVTMVVGPPSDRVLNRKRKAATGYDEEVQTSGNVGSMAFTTEKTRRNYGARRLPIVVAVIALVSILSIQFHTTSNENIEADALRNKNESSSPPFEVSSPPENIKEVEKDEPSTRLELLTFSQAHCKGAVVNQTRTIGQDPLNLNPAAVFPKSVLVKGDGLVELYDRENKYIGSIMELEGCVTFMSNYDKASFRLIPESSNNPETELLSQHQQSLQLHQKKFSTAPDLRKPHTRIVFSATSSEYFGFQVFANAYAFLHSNQTNASWMRLLTSRQPDDLSTLDGISGIPTFTAPKSVFSQHYGPINKPDVIDKWFHSQDAPHPDDTILVIDPDNWLLRDVNKWAMRVSHKHALGMKAYYMGLDSGEEDLWGIFCRQNCQKKYDPVGVPYLIKASDLKEVAPLWRSYAIRIKEELQSNQTFLERYGDVGVEWTSEMFGYNFACAHLNITTETLNDLQVRDVETSATHVQERWSRVPMIHMGRAWFPNKEKQYAERWRHTDGKDFESFGIQVWCKANHTSPSILPWPIPKGTDFVSRHTLSILHESQKYFGPIPENEEFRKKKNPGLYHLEAP